MEIEYIGEHLLPGKIGNLFVILAFVSALVSCISYFAAAGKDAMPSWGKLGRWSFRVHSFSVVGIIASLFYLLVNQYFEYYYVWQHSNSEMPMRYILSCFWEGQEGSFLLWSFWHVVLGNVLIRTSGKWEFPVMTVFAAVQTFLGSMLLGIILFDYKIGSNPFTVLLRENPDFANLPLFTHADYLEHLDGRGLNPLLQNYWMTIHPPTLFLGFASTLIPFAYAIAGLWKREYQSWVKPALPWAFFGVMILGTGILMGGAWAYEALSFGGFWAWDPVENASLVPWLTFVGAAHLMLIQKNKGSALGGAFVLTLLTFILILYSTFLTRSGILGEASVHAFTDLGMSGQLLLYLLFFLGLAIVLFVSRIKELPGDSAEEKVWTREFWMFIGALVLFLSALQVTATTSLPVVNAIFGTDYAQPTDVISHFNQWQIPLASLVCLMIGFTQFLKYKNTDFGTFIKKILPGLGIAIAITLVIAFGMEVTNPFFLLLLFTSSFAITANLDYAGRVLKGKIKKAGASIAHVGFGMIMLGALISTSKSDFISQNSSQYDVSFLGEKYSNNENILLLLNDTLEMGDYQVVYRGKEKKGVNIYYEVDYLRENEKGELAHEFTLHPLIQVNPRMGNVAEPDTRHFLGKDIYTHITYAELEERTEEEEKTEYEKPELHTVRPGDTMYVSNAIVVLDSIVRKQTAHPDLKDSDIAVGARLSVFDFSTKLHHATPLYVLRDTSFTFSIPSFIEPLGLKFTFDKVNPETGEVDINIYSSKKTGKEFIVMKAIVFPYINVLWLGCILLIIGTVIAIISRVKQLIKK